MESTARSTSDADPLAAESRRSFLERALRASVFLAVPAASGSLFAGATRAQDAERTGDALDEALALANRESKACLVLRFPDGSKGQARCLAGLASVIDGHDPSALELFALAVVVCIASKDVARRVPESRESESAILLDAKGRRTEGRVLDDETWLDGSALLQALRELVEGKDGARLRERAAAARKALPAEELRSLDSWLAEGWGAHAAAGGMNANEWKGPGDLFRRHGDALAPILVLRKRETRDDAERQLLLVALGLVLIAHDPAKPRRDRRLPFGIEQDATALRPPLDPCPPCGMAVLPAISRKFVGLMGKG